MFKKSFMNVLTLLFLLMFAVGLTACNSSEAGGDTSNNDTPVAEADEPKEQEPQVIVEECDEAEVLLDQAVAYFNGLPENNHMMPADKFKEQFELSRDSVFVLDIRRAEDYNEGHLEGSLNIPMGEIGQRITEIPTDKEIAVVCYSGQTASQTAGVLRMAGFNTKIITGGFNKIKEEGFELVN